MKRIILSLITGIFLFSGCDGDFEEINTNPNKQTTVSNSSAILKAQIQLSEEIVESMETGFGKWVQYYTSDWNALRSFHTDDVNIFWNYHALQTSVFRSIEEVFRNTDETPHNNYRAMALVLKSWAYLYITDLLGPVPYFDATQGDIPGADPSVFRPKFDSQQEIYTDINTVLKEANSLFDPDAKDNLAVEKAVDIFAQGNMLLWKKFANSLRARMLIRMSDADPSFAGKELGELFDNPSTYPVLTSNEEDFGMVWVGGANASYANSLAEYLRQNEYTWPASSGLVNMLGRLNDPRMEVYFTPTKGSVKVNDPVYVGAPTAINGEKYSTFIRDTISEVNERFAKYDQKKYVLTYAELMFIKAEAAFKGFINGDATSFYEEGIRANMKKFEISDEEIATYLKQEHVKITALNAIEQIITQRYISMFFQARDIYPEIRRTGYPALDYYKIGNITADVAKGYPEKHMYPGSSDIRRNEYFEALGVSDNTMWGCKLWFASKRPHPVKIYDDTVPTALTAWRKTDSGYEFVKLPYKLKGDD